MTVSIIRSICEIRVRFIIKHASFLFFEHESWQANKFFENKAAKPSASGWQAS
jgi:hypothetical protein